MLKISEKIKDFFKSNFRTAIFVLFILELFLNIWITPDRYDSAFFIGKMQEMSLFDFISLRYKTWTSRILIETVLCSVLMHNKILWILLNTTMTTLIGYSVIKLFVEDDDKHLTWMSICLILLYPLNKVATCDWGAGTVNYTWPLALLLFSSIGIKKIFDGEKIKKYMYPIYSLALLFACNQEQSCMIAFGLYFIFIILAFLKNKKKIHPFIIIQSIIVILSIIFIATCPGNYERKSDEILTYYNDFKTLGIIDKCTLGLTSTVNNLLVESNLVFLVFSLITTGYIFKNYKQNLYRGISLIPIVASLSCGIFSDMITKVYPYFGIFIEMLSAERITLTVTNYTNFMNFLPLILAFVVLGSVALNLLLIFKNLRSNLAIIIYVLGVMSRIAMGFSPTIFASTDRTFMFLEFAFIIISILIWKESMKNTENQQVKLRTKIATFIAILAVLQYCHTLIYTLISQV